MTKYNFPVPSARGLSNPIAPQAISTQDSGDWSDVRDLIIHAAICRVAFTDDSNLEFLTKYNQETDTVDLDIDEELLNKLTKVTVGSNLEKYFSWLTNSIVNLRRDTLQFTIGSDTTVSIGDQGVGIQVGYDAIIDRIDIFANTTGSIRFDVLKGAAEDYPVKTSISGTTKAAIINDVKTVEVPLDGWTLDLNRGDVLYYNVEDAVGIGLVTIILHVLRYSVFDNQI